MAQLLVNTGTSNDFGDGDTLRTAFTKINENFSELYTLTGSSDTAALKDIKGSVFAADSTVLVDSVNGTLNAATLTGALPAIDGSALTGITATTLGGQNASYYLDYNNFTNTPTTLAGYGITDALTSGGDFEGNLSGSVFADNSTLLVDGVNGIIPGSVIDGQISVPSISGVGGGSTNTLDLYADLVGQVSKNGQKRIFATDTINDVFEIGTTAPYSEYQPTLKVYGNAQFGSITLTGGSALTGDISGSVYADNSTLLVDGVNGTLNSSALTLSLIHI